MLPAEKGVALDRITVDLRGGENRRPAHAAKNPTGTTPCLELPAGPALGEVTLICEYLAAFGRAVNQPLPDVTWLTLWFDCMAQRPSAGA